MKKKMISILSSIMLTVISVIMFSGCYYERASDYTEEEHIARVTKLAKQRYIDNGEYTSLEVFPLYDENDELGYFLIELEPAGHVYVRLNKREVYGSGRSLYTRCEMLERPWIKHEVDYSADSFSVSYYGRKYWFHDVKPIETDNDGTPILHFESPFYSVDLNKERGYFINNRLAPSMEGYVVAVKRNDRLYNLISLKEFDEVETDQYNYEAGVFAYFILCSSDNL